MKSVRTIFRKQLRTLEMYKAQRPSSSGMYLHFDEEEEDSIDTDNINVDQIEGVMEDEGYQYAPTDFGSQLYQPDADSQRPYRMLRRKPAKTFFCEQCQKEIKYPSKIAEHLRKHNGDKPYKCQMCPQSFTQGHVLKVHMLATHSGQRPFKCQFCAKMFSSANQRRIHERTHGNLSVATVNRERQQFQVVRSNTELRAHQSQQQRQRNEQMTVQEHQNLIEEVETQAQIGLLEPCLYECPYVNCGMQSEDMAVVQAHMETHSEEDWNQHMYAQQGGDHYVVEGGGDGEGETSADYYYPYEEEEEEVMVDEDAVLSPLHTQNGESAMKAENQGKQEIKAENRRGLSVYVEHGPGEGQHTQEYYEEGSDAHEMSHAQDSDVPFHEGEIEVETTRVAVAERVLLSDSSNQMLVDDGTGQVRVLNLDIGVSNDVVYTENEEQVRVTCDPRPPRKGRQPNNNKEIEIRAEMNISASTVVMTAPSRQSVEARPRYPRNKSAPARNLDWIIDAVAKGVDVDTASPHNRKKPQVHVCRYCGKVDKYPSKIEAHMRTHTGEKPYKCEICGMGFAQRTPMRLHVRRHLDHKPYVCNVPGCSLKFVSGALLNIHQHQKHFQTKKYVCMKGCGRFFASGRNQRHHELGCYYSSERAGDLEQEIYDRLLYNEEHANAEDDVEEEEEEPEEPYNVEQDGLINEMPNTLDDELIEDVDRERPFPNPCESE